MRGGAIDKLIGATIDREFEEGTDLVRALDAGMGRCHICN